jgi:UDP-GlcNAc:undecaprenyl-phosphate GlcNAc-1-phosphate transferase
MSTTILYLILSFFLSILLSLVLIKLVQKIFYRFKIVDNPKKYNKKRDPIPYSTGIIFFIVFFILSYFFVEHSSNKLYLIWIFGFLVTIISFFDDILNVSARWRLIFQIVIWAVIWITSIKIWYVSNIFGWVLDLETYNFTVFNHTIYIIPLIFTIFWYVFIFNALNWTDWIEWNTSWLSIISFLVLFFLWMILFLNDDYEWWIMNAKFIMWLTAILVWILIPFWFFDIKQKILMWDSGTMFLWFMLATLAIISGWKIATVLVVFGIYTVDAVYVLVKRLLNKKNLLSWDFTHLHHRLLKLWLKKKQILILIYSLSFFFWISSLFLDKTWKIIVFWIIVIVVVFINKVVEIFIKKR